MPLLVKSDDVEAALRKILKKDGYSLCRQRRVGENGVDILAKRRSKMLHIECIGYKSSRPARAKDFYESFFRVTSRLNDGATRLILAMSHRAGVGLPE